LLKAVFIREHGAIGPLCYEEITPPRLTSPSDVVVKLKAASVDDIDPAATKGLPGAEAPPLLVLGADGAGTVFEAGPEVKNLDAGDRVCLYPARGCGLCEFCSAEREFMCPRRRPRGTYAEYVKVGMQDCYAIPDGLSFDEAAAIPSAYLTAWHMLVTGAQIRPGEHVLIPNIGGGVACAALQIAKAFGARVIVASESDEKLAVARERGADHGVNERRSDLASEVRQLTAKRGVDIVVASVGRGHWDKSLAALAKGGRLAVCGAGCGPIVEINVRRIFWNQLAIFGSTLGSRAEFQELLSFFGRAGIRPIVDRGFPLKEAAAAHRLVEADGQFGKVVLRVDE
jgi:NADPH:quinone reductase-like Zn-dependent oxidoreductase